MGPLTIDMYLPSFPTIVSAFGTTATYVQFSLTACLLGIGLGQLILGPMSDVHGRKKPLLIALIVYFLAQSYVYFHRILGSSLQHVSYRALPQLRVSLFRELLSEIYIADGN